MKKFRVIILIIFFLIGATICTYPFISRWYYSLSTKDVIKNFDSEVSKIDETQINYRIKLAQAYNDSLKNMTTYKDPYVDNKIKEGKKEYARMLEVKEQIGNIKIPKLLLEIPIYAGTSEEVLQKGVGHMEGTSLPVGGNNTHSVLTAHTGLPESKLFTDIDKLKEGDKFYIKNIKEMLAYQVDQIKVVNPSDFKDLLIVQGYDYVTLLTCTPYMINTHRLLVRGHRIPYVKEVYETQVADYIALDIYRYLFFITLLILISLLAYLLIKKRRKRDNEK